MSKIRNNKRERKRERDKKTERQKKEWETFLQTEK
jgi:hypothetical protein